MPVDAQVSELLLQLINAPSEDAKPKPAPKAAVVAAAPAPAPVAKAPVAGGIKIVSRVAAKPVEVPATPLKPTAAEFVPVGAAAPEPPAKQLSRKEAAEAVVSHVQANGVLSLQSTGLLGRLAEMIEDQSSQGAREGAAAVYESLADLLSSAVEPWLVGMVPVLLERLADKAAPVRVAAAAALDAIQRIVSPEAVPALLPQLCRATAPSRKWQTKEGAYKMIGAFTETAPQACAEALPELVPVVSDGVVDARDEVKKVAHVAAEGAFALAGNRDIAACVPSFLACIQKPKEVPDAIIKLAGTTFVQAVEAPALAVMTPLLIKGLREDAVVRRKTALIISNMSKLVTNPADAELFLPKLLPRLEQAAAETPDPECRSVCAMAEATVKKVVAEGQGAGGGDAPEGVKKLGEAEALQALMEAIAEACPAFPPAPWDDFIMTALKYVAFVGARLTNARQLEADAFRTKAVAPFLAPLLASSASAEGVDAQVEALAAAWVGQCDSASRVKVVDEDSDDDDEVLCSCEFSLAYGAKILLNNARMRLKRGRRYGLCGHNGVGKSTLMRAINAGQVDGFPPKDVLTTVYLESDIDPNLVDLPVTEFVFRDPALASKSDRPSMDEVNTMLREVGFDDVKMGMAVGSLSGGWKMKLALARAMLMKPHILLLDEPTNHLDVTNVAWLENYVTKVIPHVTCLVVSHDSGFLDNVCTDIMHYEQRKLRYYRGNLSEFVKVKPEAKSYYTLQAATLKFIFPKPAFLDGVTSQEKPILSAKKVTFAYPGAAKPQLAEVTATCRLSSRVAILGPNGAGKSTLIKLMTGELKPDTGTITKHPNVKVAYVSQHALHHLEEHLDRTPNQYIRRRYQKGEDSEEAEKVTRQLSPEEEEAIRNQVWMIDNQRRILDILVGRRKKKKTFEYEVKWKGLSSIEYNRWITREELVERGFGKIVREMDDKINAEKGEAAARPLTMASVEAYLQDFGLEPEFGTHSAIRGLSGGQKVKLVLAAALWHCPHLLVLDEPTNYLDRDSLGALAQAIKEFEGGVVMISHHNEFVGALANEVWELKDGKLTCHAKTPGPAAASH